MSDDVQDWLCDDDEAWLEGEPPVTQEELDDAIIEDTVHCAECNWSMLCGDNDCFVMDGKAYCVDHVHDAIEALEKEVEQLREDVAIYDRCSTYWWREWCELSGRPRPSATSSAVEEACREMDAKDKRLAAADRMAATLSGIEKAAATGLTHPATAAHIREVLAAWQAASEDSRA